MRSVGMVLFLLPLGQFTAAADENPVGQELLGEWVCTTLYGASGKEDPEGLFQGIRFRFTEALLVIRVGNREVKHKYQPDSKRSPAWMDLFTQAKEHEGKVCRGIYRLEGATLTIVLNTRGDGERPTDFKPPAPASGYSLYQLRREK